MSSLMDKKLRAAISILEGNPPPKTPLPTTKRQKDPFAEACNEVRRISAEEEYWSKAYTSRAINGVFDCLEKDDANLRILAEQCLNTILRKFLSKSHSSRALAVLLNELARKSSARGFACAFSMFNSCLPHAKDQRLPIYLLHFINTLKEALKRPEQSVHLAIEQLVANIFSHFHYDFDDNLMKNLDVLVSQCCENFCLSGAQNRAASSVISALYGHCERIRVKIAQKLYSILISSEEKNDKNVIVATLITLRKIWPELVKLDLSFIQSLITKVLCCLRANLSEIQTATLELIEVIVNNSEMETLDFKPHLIREKADQAKFLSALSSPQSRLASLSLEKDLHMDSEEVLTISRYNSCTSLQESVSGSARSEEADVFDNDDDDEDSQPKSDISMVNELETDPLFRKESPADFLADSINESESVNPIHTSREPVEGLLCSSLPLQFDVNSNFYQLTSQYIATKFLVTSIPTELKLDSEVRISLKVLALKCLAVLSSKYSDISKVHVGKQSIMDICLLLDNEDDSLSMTTFEFLANLECLKLLEGRKNIGNTNSKFLLSTIKLLKQASPRKTKEILQIFSNNMPILTSDEVLLTTVCDASIESFDCDYFLLKIARSEFLANIEWKKVSAAFKESHQKLCTKLLISQLFDSDYRVSNATSNLLHLVVQNADFGPISNVFHTQWPESMTAPSFKHYDQIYALHRFYSFRGDTPDLVIELNLAEVLELLQEEYLKAASERFSGFISGLSNLTTHFSPSIYSSPWFSLSSKAAKGLLNLLLEAATSYATTQTQLLQLLRLIARIYAGSVENLFTQYANQPKDKDTLLFMDGQNVLDKVLELYLRVFNLYFTIVRESSTKIPASAMSSPLFTRTSWGVERNLSLDNRSYSISHLVGTGIHPTRRSSYTYSSTLRHIEPLVRGAYSNLSSSVKPEVEERFTALLEAALDGFAAVLSMLSRDLLNSCLDELFLYMRTLINYSLGPVTVVVGQLMSIIFDKNAFHINPNILVSLRTKHVVPPSDQLEMYVGRSINNFSVYIAFLDRTEHMTLHQLRHFGWINMNHTNNEKRSSAHSLEIGARLEQFERFVVFLLQSFLGNAPAKVKDQILTVLGILVQNDVRYDQLDPQSRIWQMVLTAIRHPNLKYASQLENMFIFTCQITRVIDVTFGEVVVLLGKCLENVNEDNVDDLLNAVHVIVLEAVGHYADVLEALMDCLKQSKTKLMVLSPSKCIQLWTTLLHFHRSTQPESSWQQISKTFIDELTQFIDGGTFKLKMIKKNGLEVAHSLTVALKTCHSTVFRPINQLFNWFFKATEVSVTATIPFAVQLLCRVDAELVTVQLEGIMDNPMDKVGRSLAKVFLKSIDELFNNSDMQRKCESAEALSFYQIMVLHILRIEFSRASSNSLQNSFKASILESISSNELVNKLLKMNILYPKIYGMFLTLIIQMDLYEESVEKLFYSNFLSSSSKQLSTLIFIQRLTNKKAEVTEEIKRFMMAAPEEFIVRLLKMAGRKQLDEITDRLDVEIVTELVSKTKHYLKGNNISGLYEPFHQLLSFKKPGQTEAVIKKHGYLKQSIYGVQNKIVSIGFDEDGLISVIYSSIQNLLRHLAECNSIVSEADVNDELLCLSKMSVTLQAKHLTTVIENIPSIYRTHFISQLFKSFNEEIKEETNSNFLANKQPSLKNVVECYQSMTKLLQSSKILSSTDKQQILLGFSQIPDDFRAFDNVFIDDFDKVLNEVFVSELIESDLTKSPVETEFFTAFTTLFNRSKLSNYSNHFISITNMYSILLLILDQLERNLPKTDRFKINSNHWNVELKGENAELLKDEILESFILVQRAAHVFSKKSLFLNKVYFKEAKRSVLAILRLPVFSRMFLMPKSALFRDFQVVIEVTKDCIVIPLVGIHMLSEMEILKDFLQRISLLGWTKKSEFEDCWMSLFGVLCSTPIGNELGGEDVHQIIEQVNASSLTVEALTNMLLLSLLYSQPGDTVNGKFVVKHRQTKDSYLFLNSINGRKASIARSQIESDHNPALIFIRNLERSDEYYYDIAQTSVFYLWNMVGELESTSDSYSNNNINEFRSSLSDYLLKATTDLDTSSSLKSLFENFFHWFEQGMDSLPTSLLSSTVKSIALLSDMFDDTSMYARVYSYFKQIFLTKHLQDHPSQGYVIYVLLKFASILDLDKLDSYENTADFYKLINVIIAYGLNSESIFLTICTLHGILYLIQSVILDDIQPQIRYYAEYVITELERLHQKADILTASQSESIEYHKLLFTTAFRMFEQCNLTETDFEPRFMKLIKEIFIDQRVPDWQKSIVSGGIQGLVCHSATYCDGFREAALELFDTYQLRPMHLPYALSVYTTCVYRYIQHENKINEDKIEVLKSEFQKLLNMFSLYSLKVEVDRFLPVVANVFATFLTKKQILDLIFTLIPSKDSQLSHLDDYDRSLFSLLHFTLKAMSLERKRETYEFVKYYILPQISQITGNLMKKYLMSLVLASVACDPLTFSLVHLLLRRSPLQNPPISSFFGQLKESFLSTANSLSIKFSADEINMLSLV